MLCAVLKVLKCNQYFEQGTEQQLSSDATLSHLAHTCSPLTSEAAAQMKGRVRQLSPETLTAVKCPRLALLSGLDLLDEAVMDTSQAWAAVRLSQLFTGHLSIMRRFRGICEPCGQR